MLAADVTNESWTVISKAAACSAHLQLQDALLNGTRNHKPHYMDRLVLAQPVDPVLRLRLSKHSSRQSAYWW